MAQSDSATAYLELLKKCLTHSIYAETATFVERPSGRVKRALFDALKRRELDVVRIRPSADLERRAGRDWPLFAHTMIGEQRLDHLQRCVEDVLAHNVPGDLIEAGVWRGGASILMRAILSVHGDGRSVWVADSFAGLPLPDPARFPADVEATEHEHDVLAVSLEAVKQNFARYGLLDEQVHFLKGWFGETLPTLSGHQWALVRLDGDTYESTTDALTNLYPDLVTGGHLIIDDYALSYCRQAVHDFRRAHGIDDEIQRIDWTGAHWRKSG